MARVLLLFLRNMSARTAFLLLLSSGLGCSGTSQQHGAQGAVNDDGGSSNSGGSGGSGGGTESGADAGATCGMRAPFGPNLSVHTLGPTGGPYEGPAIVERSTANDLFLYFEPRDPRMDAADTTAMHARITGLDPMPVLPIATKVWIANTPAGDESGGLGYPAPGWALSVRNRQGGTLLFGAAFKLTDAISVPVATGAVTPFCTGRNPMCSLGSSEVTYADVEVLGDTPVTIRDSETAVVRLAGIDYDVRVSAQQVTPAADCRIADYAPDSGVSLDVRAKELAGLLDTLEGGALPSCVVGNDRAVEMGFMLHGATLGTAYDGRVFYERKDSTSDNDTLYFKVEGLPDTVAGQPPEIAISLPPTIFPEPKLGDEFWATMPDYSMGALRDAQSGRLRLAAVYAGSTPVDASKAAMIEQMLGFPVRFFESCKYANSQNGVFSLWDVEFGTTVPVRVHSGSVGSLQIEGSAYEAWVWAEQSMVWFSIYAL